MASEKKKQDETRYQVYLDERGSLIEAARLGAQQFDKAVLTLAAGALAISITFLDKICPQPEKGTIFILCSSWACFILSMLSTLFSFLVSQKACFKQIDILEKRQQDSSQEAPRNGWASMTWVLNWCSILLFAAGIGLLAYFSFLNLHQKMEGNMARQEKAGVSGGVVAQEPSVDLNRGIVPQKPPAGQKPDATSPKKPDKTKK